MKQHTGQHSILERKNTADQAENLLPHLAYVKTNPSGEGEKSPTTIFIHGFKSDMEGTKATHLEDFCKSNGYGFVRFDCTGHGKSGGEFEKSTIGTWLADTLCIIDELTTGDLVLIGSSMGGWLALLAALRRKQRVKGIIGIAAAPDFTKTIENEMDESQKQMLAEKGYFELPSGYPDSPYIITRELIEEGKNHLLLNDKINLNIPVRLFQGKQDASVDWHTAEKIKQTITGEDVEITYIDDGDHSLSREQDLHLITKELSKML